MIASQPKLDVVTIGRSSVDLYGPRSAAGSRTWRASPRRSAAARPTSRSARARLGLKSGLITRVGDEHMGRYIREQLAREGVDVAGVHTDPDRLTSLVLLGIRDSKSFPLIFYRDNCADSALDETDIDEDYIACGRCDRGHRHAFRPGGQRRRPAARHALRQDARPQDRLRRRLPAEPLGPRGPWRRRGAVHRLGRGQRPSGARSFPIATSSSAPRRS